MTAALALPTRRVEEWKYSDLARALGDAGFGDASARVSAGKVSGVEQFDLSRPNPPDWVARHFAVADRNIMGAASLTLSDGGVALRVTGAVTAPLKLAFHGTGHVRGLLVLEAGASATLVEGVGIADFRNVGFEIVLGEGAVLEHVRVSPESADAVLVEEASLRIAAGCATPTSTSPSVKGASPASAKVPSSTTRNVAPPATQTTRRPAWRRNACSSHRRAKSARSKARPSHIIRSSSPIW